MLKVRKIASASGVQKYLAEGKEHYYSEGHEEKGYWHGGEFLGLNGEVQQGDLKNILEGRNADGVLQGKVFEKRRVGWDCTFSAPKSVSIVWAFSEGEERKRIEEAHDKAVIKALDYLKTYALDDAIRKGKGGIEKEAVKEIPIAVYKHFTSRENDMQIHSHAILPNMALRQDGKVVGIEPSQVFKRMQEIGIIYQAELGKNLKSIGYRIENDKSSIRIKDFDAGLENMFSKRSKIINEAIEAENAITGKHKDAIKLLTRKNKKHTSPELIKEKWSKELHENGYKLENIRCLKNDKLDLSNEIDENEKRKIKNQIIDKVLDNMSNTRSTFHEFELRKEIAQQSRALFGADEIIDVIEDAKKSMKIFELGFDRYTTKDILDIENGLHEKVSLLNGVENHSCSKESLEKCLVKEVKGKFLSAEQVKMIEHIVKPEAIKVVEGLPGTGKSFALERACELFQENGYTVRGLAPTGKAAENLEDLNINAVTVDKFFYDFERGRDSFKRNDIVFVDEAAMLGSKKTAKLIDHVQESGAKIIFVGDSKQLQPLDAGGAFHMIKSEIGYVELKDIRRQNEEWQRKAIIDIRNGQVEKALHSYLSHDKIKVSDNQENMIKNITEKYISERIEHKNQSQLVLCGTNYQVQEINQSIRESLKENGSIQKDKACTIEVKNRTNEKSQKEFCVEDRIYFLQNSTKINVKNGSLGKIEKITKNKLNEVILDVKLDNKKKIKVNTKEYNKIDHGYACTVHKSQGSTVDKVYVAIDRMDNEMSGVALSRHRDSVTIYTNKENHVDLFQSHEQKQEIPLSLENDFKIAIENMNKSISKSNQKDTTIEYQTKEYATQWHIDKAKELLVTKDVLRKYDIIKEISVQNLGVENPFLEAKKGLSTINKEAYHIIDKGEFKKDDIDKLCQNILKMPVGQKSIFNSQELVDGRALLFKDRFDKLEEKLRPKQKIEIVKEVEKEISRNRFSRSRSPSREREGREISMDRGFGMGR